LREPNPILFFFFFAGALFRRERHLLSLIAGGVAGMACRFVGAAIVYGSALFVKPQNYHFTGLFLSQNLIMYSTALLLLVPGGLIFALAYRGHRRPELVGTIAAFAGIFLVYNYNAGSSGGLKQWILSLRFLIPAVPLLAFAMAHTCPRWYRRFHRARSEQWSTWNATVKTAVLIWLAGIIPVSLVVNWSGQRWCNLHQSAVHALYGKTDPSQPVLADLPATIKFLNELYGQRMVAEIMGLSSHEIESLLARYPAVQIVFFDRDDSSYWVGKTEENQSVIDALAKQFVPTLALQQRFPGLGVLQIWKITRRS
jgi:hypothetical protein